MSRRRRQRNPLLVRIVVISLAAHVIALPILAHFGAFDKGRKTFGTATVVINTPQKQMEKPPPPAQKAHKAQSRETSKSTDKGQKATSRKDLTHVITNGSGAGTGPAVEQGEGKGGALPPGVDKGTSRGGTTPPPPPDHHDDTPKAKENPTPEPKESNSKPTPPPKDKPIPPPHVPVYTEVEPTFQPQPEIPDDLRSDPLDKTAVIEAVISADGTVESAQLAQGTGIGELDQLALKTAKTWRFRPATADGAPVEGKLRLRIEFKVE